MFVGDNVACSLNVLWCSSSATFESSLRSTYGSIMPVNTQDITNVAQLLAKPVFQDPENLILV